MATKRIPKDQQKPKGRPTFKPSEAQRNDVKTLSAVNFKHDAIAEYIGIDSDTLRKHFKQELLTTKMKMLGNAASRLAQAVDRGEAWAVCFLLKTQGKELGWSERYEVTGKEGGAIPLRLESLTDAQLGILIERIEGAISSRGSEGRA